MIYADACLSVEVNEGLRQSEPSAAFGWVPTHSREAEEVQSGVLKVTQCGMVKRRRS